MDGDITSCVSLDINNCHIRYEWPARWQRVSCRSLVSRAILNWTNVSVLLLIRKLFKKSDTLTFALLRIAEQPAADLRAPHRCQKLYEPKRSSYEKARTIKMCNKSNQNHYAATFLDVTKIKREGELRIGNFCHQSTFLFSLCNNPERLSCRRIPSGIRFWDLRPCQDTDVDISLGNGVLHNPEPRMLLTIVVSTSVSMLNTSTVTNHTRIHLNSILLPVRPS